MTERVKKSTVFRLAVSRSSILFIMFNIHNLQTLARSQYKELSEYALGFNKASRYRVSGREDECNKVLLDIRARRLKMKLLEENEGGASEVIHFSYPRS